MQLEREILSGSFYLTWIRFYLSNDRTIDNLDGLVKSPNPVTPAKAGVQNLLK